MESMELEKGDVVQLNPEYEAVGGFFLVVTEPKEWGCLGYLLSFDNFTATRYKGKAYLMPRWKDMEFVGKSFWICEDKSDEEDEEVES